MPTRILPVSTLALYLLFVACAGEPPVTTAAQYFAAMKDNMAAMEYAAALKNIDFLLKAPGHEPLDLQARLLQVALLTAVADGRREMAEAYDQGRKEPAARESYSEFTRVRADYYRGARDHLIAAMETFLKHRGELESEPIPLEVAFPGFSGGESTTLARIRSGLWAGADDRQRAELEVTRNALARILTRLVRAEDDLHKGQEIFQQGNVEISPCCYLVEMSRTMVEVGKVFDPEALDDARFRRISYEIARDNVDTALELMGDQPNKEHLAKARKFKALCEKSLKAMK